MDDDRRPTSSTPVVDPVDGDATPEERAVEAALRPRTLDEFVGQERVRDQLVARARGGRRARPHARPRAALRPARARQDHAGDDHRRRARRAAARHQRPGHPARGRPRRDPVRRSTRARSCSSTRSTAWRARPRSCSTWRWRTSGSTSSSARAPAPRRSRWRSRRSPSSAPPPAPGCCPARCATGSASPRTSTSTTPTSWSASSTARPACSASRSTDAGGREIAGRSRGTPRIANRLLRRVRDFAEVRADGTRRPSTRRAAALALYEVDELGLDRLDRAVLVGAVRQLRRRPGRARDARRRRRRGARDRRGARRAVPGAARLPGPHAARAGRHAAGLAPPRARAAATIGRRQLPFDDAGRRRHEALTGGAAG